MHRPEMNISMMDTLFIGLSFLLLLLEGFFSGSEIAVVGADLLKIRDLAGKGDLRARKVHYFLKHPDRLLSTTLLGTNLCVVVNASIVTYLLSSKLGFSTEGLATLILSPLVLILGEIIPKSLAQRMPTSIALRSVSVLSWIYLIFRPLSASLLFMAKVMVPGCRELGDRFYFSREDLALLVEDHQGVADIEEQEREIIHKVIGLSDIQVRETMKPVNQVLVLEDGEPALRAMEIFKEWGYSRIPVYSDNVYNIVGVVTIYDLLKVEDPALPVGKVKRAAYFVPEYKRVDDLLQEMKERRVPMAVVVDEYGAAIGITTVEDLVEELVGEIQDDFDLSLPRLEEMIEEEGGYVVDACVELDLLKDKLGWELHKKDVYETVSGFLLYHLGRIPNEGEKIDLEGFSFRILETDEKSIKKVWIALAETRD
jgi:CBS domain containing-hemolysin-like protein